MGTWSKAAVHSAVMPLKITFFFDRFPEANNILLFVFDNTQVPLFTVGEKPVGGDSQPGFPRAVRTKLGIIEILAKENVVSWGLFGLGSDGKASVFRSIRFVRGRYKRLVRFVEYFQLGDSQFIALGLLDFRKDPPSDPIVVKRRPAIRRFNATLVLAVPRHLRGQVQYSGYRLARVIAPSLA